MKELPIIFSGEMVRAILDGRKTQTRRVIKSLDYEDSFYGPQVFEPECIDRNGEYYPGDPIFGIYGDDWHIKCPYGQPGDRLWVRETWQALELSYDHETSAVDDLWAAEGSLASIHSRLQQVSTFRPSLILGYRANFVGDDDDPEIRGFPWRSPIHMPRWASRITLEVTDVRVERAQDISEEDARAEGVVFYPRWTDEVPDLQPVITLYAKLWDSIYARRGYGWDANPWVFVVEFRRIRP